MERFSYKKNIYTEDIYIKKYIYKKYIYEESFTYKGYINRKINILKVIHIEKI